MPNNTTQAGKKADRKEGFDVMDCIAQRVRSIYFCGGIFPLFFDFDKYLENNIKLREKKVYKG